MPQARTAPATQRWGILFDHHLPAVYGFVFSQVGNREEAETLTTRIFGEAARQLPDPADVTEALELLDRLARATVFAYLGEMYGPDVSAGDRTWTAPWNAVVTPKDERGATPAERVAWVLEQLPRPARDLLTRRLLAGESLEATARMLDLTLAQAAQLQYVALREASDLVAASDATHLPAQATVCCQAGG